MTQFWFPHGTNAITVPHHMIRVLLQYHKSTGMNGPTVAILGSNSEVIQKLLDSLRLTASNNCFPTSSY